MQPIVVFIDNTEYLCGLACRQLTQGIHRWRPLHSATLSSSSWSQSTSHHSRGTGSSPRHTTPSKSFLMQHTGESLDTPAGAMTAPGSNAAFWGARSAAAAHRLAPARASDISGFAPSMPRPPAPTMPHRPLRHHRHHGLSTRRPRGSPEPRPCAPWAAPPCTGACCRTRLRLTL